VAIVTRVDGVIVVMIQTLRAMFNFRHIVTVRSSGVARVKTINFGMLVFQVVLRTSTNTTNRYTTNSPNLASIFPTRFWN
jgi:hypothetical protein